MIPIFIKSLAAPVAKPKPKPKAAAAPATPKKDAPDLAHFSKLLALLSDCKSGGDFGEHNVESGHHVAFSAGAYAGSGKVSATGRDGLTVEDESKREHRIHWREVTGHFAPEKEDKPAKPKAKNAA